MTQIKIISASTIRDATRSPAVMEAALSVHAARKSHNACLRYQDLSIILARRNPRITPDQVAWFTQQMQETLSGPAAEKEHEADRVLVHMPVTSLEKALDKAKAIVMTPGVEDHETLRIVREQIRQFSTPEPEVRPQPYERNSDVSDAIWELIGAEPSA